MSAQRIQRQRTKGWKMPANTVYVGRPTRWGNPFVTSKVLSSQEAIEAYGALLRLDYRYIRQIGFGWTAAGWFPAMSKPKDHQAFVKAILAPLEGKNLACWCRLDQPCHADVLLELANAGAK